MSANGDVMSTRYYYLKSPQLRFNIVQTNSASRNAEMEAKTFYSHGPLPCEFFLSFSDLDSRPKNVVNPNAPFSSFFAKKVSNLFSVFFMRPRRRQLKPLSPEQHHASCFLLLSSSSYI